MVLTRPAEWRMQNICERPRRFVRDLSCFRCLGSNQREHGDERALRRLRVIVNRLDRKPGLENASCQRMLWPDGTLFELIRLDRSRSGREDFRDEEFEAWITSFPVTRA